MLQIQKYLSELKNSGLTIEEMKLKLFEEHGVNMRIYSDGFVLLDYDQIAASKTNQIAIECRSLIMDSNSFSIISRKFDRFFNAGENPEHVLNFNVSRSTVFLKEDGSIIGIYWNRLTNQWEVSTRGMALAEGEHYMGKSFRNMVIDALGVGDEVGFQRAMTSACAGFDNAIYFTFEWVSPLNKICTPYDTSELVLLGVGVDGNDCTSLISNMEYWVNRFKTISNMNVRMPRMFDGVSDLNDALAKANALTGLLEGFVLYDPSINKRIKVKSLTYVTAHRLRGNDPVPTRKNMLELVLTGEVEEFLVYFNEWTDLVRGLQTEVETFLHETELCYNANNGIESQKEFALAVKDSKGAAYMFSARKLNQDVRTVFNNASLNQKMKTFGV